MKENNNDELQFVVNQYKEGHKNPDTAWNEFLGLSGLSTRTSSRRWLAVALRETDIVNQFSWTNTQFSVKYHCLSFHLHVKSVCRSLILANRYDEGLF